MDRPTEMEIFYLGPRVLERCSPEYLMTGYNSTSPEYISNQISRKYHKIELTPRGFYDSVHGYVSSVTPLEMTVPAKMYLLSQIRNLPEKTPQLMELAAELEYRLLLIDQTKAIVDKGD